MSISLIEDSLKKVGDRYNLVLLASRRARSISLGFKSFLKDVNENDHKPTVLALMEISYTEITEEFINNQVINNSEYDVKNVANVKKIITPNEMNLVYKDVNEE
jgi:DNA-directed RNA polymerase subunit omega